jgi:uncharacterized FlgJ-related protein
VTSEMMVGIARKKSAKEVWDAVKSMRVDDDCVKSASLQRLSKEYESVKESVDDFAMRINGLIASQPA